MVAQPKKTVKVVKVVALRGFKIERLVKDAAGAVTEDNSIMVKPGEVVEVTEKRAADLCREIRGSYAFSGERYLADGDCHRHDLTIARRATQRDLVQHDALLAAEEREV